MKSDRDLRMALLLVASLISGYEYGIMPGIAAFLFGLALLK